MTEADSIQSLTDDLPLSVRTALARCWLLAVACEASIDAQPRDNLPEQLWQISLPAEDLADLGGDALFTLSDDLAQLLIEEAAAAAMVCPSCLAQLIYGEEEASDDE